MDYFAGLDVSVKETSVCIVDELGKIVREAKVASEPEALLSVLKNPAYRFKRIELEAGPLSQWLFSALGEAELPVVCVETRHMQAVLKARPPPRGRMGATTPILCARQWPAAGGGRSLRRILRTTADQVLTCSRVSGRYSLSGRIL